MNKLTEETFTHLTKIYEKALESSEETVKNSIVTSAILSQINVLELNKQYEGANVMYQSASQELASLQAQVNQLEAENTHLLKEVRNKTEDCAYIENDLLEVSKLFDVAKNELVRTEETIKDLEDDIAMLKQDIRDAEDDNQDLDDEVEKLECTIADLNQTNLELVEEIEMLNDNVKDLEQEIAELEEQFND